MRKELETMLSHEGDACLTQSTFPEQHPILYWNLVSVAWLNCIVIDRLLESGIPSVYTLFKLVFVVVYIQILLNHSVQVQYCDYSISTFLCSIIFNKVIYPKMFLKIILIKGTKYFYWRVYKRKEKLWKKYK